jgi:4-amino-4-deoxy-L-arabinose transferase-like glycosyltransferase
MIADTLVCLLLVLGVAFGLSLHFIDLFRLRPAESVVAGAALSLIAAWAIAWAIFVTGAPLWMDVLLPALACAGFAFTAGHLRRVAGLWKDPGARDLLGGQLMVSAWCVGWLSFVKAHTGGAWTGDSFEHWQRAHFFLREWPPGRLFIDLFQMPARPPLANVLTAAFMQVTRVDYAHYQLLTTLLCSLAYLPVGLLAGRFGGRPAARLAVVVLMLNPLFLQNATYPWTKLIAVFFILTGLYFFLRVRDDDGSSASAAVVCGLSLGGAVVTHYSAGPYVAVLAAAWIAMGWRRAWRPPYLRMTGGAVLAGACVLAPWFAWSVAQYGWDATFLSNSSITTLDKWQGNHLVKIALNLRDTLVPPQVRGFSGTLFRQSSPWGRLRDQCFLLYQLNLLLALGCVGWIAVLRESAREAVKAAARDRVFWTLALAGFVIGSIAVYGDREHYGITHICLQSVVLLGLAFLASRWHRLGRGWKCALIAGWSVDFALGIALQFAVEDFAIDRWLEPGRSLAETARTYNGVAQVSLDEKIIAHLVYFADILATPPALVLALLASIFCMAVLRARRVPVDANSP